MAALLAGATVIACQSRDERDVREWLDAEGFEGVRLTAPSERDAAWRYTATRNGDQCSGRIAIARRSGHHTIEDMVTCRPAWNACRHEAPTACFRLGEIFERGDPGSLDPTRSDPVRATTLFTTACNADHASACNALGVKMAAGSGTPRDPGGALALFEKACRLGSRSGCSNVSCATTSSTAASRVLLGCADLSDM